MHMYTYYPIYIIGPYNCSKPVRILFQIFQIFLGGDQDNFLA